MAAGCRGRGVSSLRQALFIFNQREISEHKQKIVIGLGGNKQKKSEKQKTKMKEKIKKREEKESLLLLSPIVWQS